MTRYAGCTFTPGKVSTQGFINGSPETYNERNGANEHDCGGGDQQDDHLDLRARQPAEAAAPAGIGASLRVSA